MERRGLCLLLVLVLACLWAPAARAEKGTLHCATDGGWSLQTAGGQVIPLPADTAGQLVDGLKAKVTLATQAGAAVLTNCKLIYPGTGVDLKLNRPVFDLNSPTMSPIMPFLVMGLRVYNDTCFPATFQFATSQRYDFEVRDAAGNVVWRWSDGQAFADMTGQETLVCSGKTALLYFARLSLLDVNGTKLAPGRYILRGWLTADRPVEATASFEVK